MMANPVNPGALKSDGSGESSEVGGGFKSSEEGGEESMLLLLPEAEGRSEISEPLSTNEERPVEAISSSESQQQMSNFSTGDGNRKLIASAYREASFV